jgi:hypothetical protein
MATYDLHGYGTKLEHIAVFTAVLQDGQLKDMVHIISHLNMNGHPIS